MDSPEKHKNSETSMPDSFGTGKQPDQKKSYRSVTLILLIILVAANLVTLAIYSRLRNPEKTKTIRDAFLLGKEQLSVASSLLGGNFVQTEICPSGQTLSDSEIRQKLLPSVVQIALQSEPETVIDTGIVLTQEGYILTNARQITSMQELNVTIPDGSVHTAMCIGYDAESDLAVLKIETQGLTPAELGDASCVRSGDSLRLLSNAEKLKSVTACETENEFALYGEKTQLLAVDLPEDGILVNRSGQVIALWIDTTQYKGMLPICTAKTLADDLINYGCINPDVPLDIQITELSDIQRRYWELPEGVMVSWLMPNGSAYLAGIRAGDLILQIDAWKIKSAEDYQKTMERLHPGDTVQLLIYRMGQEYSITVAVNNSQEGR